MKHKVILRGFRDLSNNWRSKWLRLGTGSELTHCTLSIGDLTLHVDYKGSNCILQFDCLMRTMTSMS